MDQFYDDIAKEMTADVSRKDVYCYLLQKCYKGKHSSADDYMNKIMKRERIDIAVYKSSSTEVIQKQKKLQNTTIFRGQREYFLWMNFDLSKAHCIYIMEHYPKIRQLYIYVWILKYIWSKNDSTLFIEKYKQSQIHELSHFADGPERNIKVVENSVASPLSNGIFEGIKIIN